MKIILRFCVYILIVPPFTIFNWIARDDRKFVQSFVHSYEEVKEMIYQG